MVLGSHVTNYSMLAQTNGLILHTSVTIGYDAPWRKIHDLLIEAALKTKHILRAPAPFVLQNALQDSYVQYEINAYTDKPLADGLHLLGSARQHSGLLLRRWRGDHVAGLFGAARWQPHGDAGGVLAADYRPRGFRIAKDDTAAAAAGGKD